jgi:hypothetical protein
MLTKCKDCLLFDDRLVEKWGTGICEADDTVRGPASRCPGAVPRVDQDSVKEEQDE